MAKIKEQKSAEERLQAEAERKQREKEEELMMLEEEKKKNEKEQHLIMIEEERNLQKENKRLKEMEQEQKSQESKLLADDSKQRHELQNSEQNKQHKAESVSSQHKQPKVKFDEEARLYEQLKVLQALRQQESEQNRKVSKDISVSVDNRVKLHEGETGSETSRPKHKEKVTVTKESERKLHEQKRSEEKTKRQKQSVKMQEEHTLEREKREDLQARENNDGLQKLTKTTEASKSEELSIRKEEEKVKQEQKEDEVNKSCSIKTSKDTSSESITRNKQLVTEKCNNQVQVTSACAEHETTLRSSTNIEKKNVKYENNQSALRNEVDGHSGSTQVQKLTAAKCQDKNSAGNELSNVWEKTVEAKRLKWMHECESWRYVQPLATVCCTFNILWQFSVYEHCRLLMNCTLMHLLGDLCSLCHCN